MSARSHTSLVRLTLNVFVVLAGTIVIVSLMSPNFPYPLHIYVFSHEAGDSRPNSPPFSVRKCLSYFNLLCTRTNKIDQLLIISRCPMIPLTGFISLGR